MRRSEGVTVAARTAAEPAPEEAWARLEALYRDCRRDLYAYVLSLLGDRVSAEDVTAQAFERAFRRRRTFDRRRGGERAWLFGIARNAALDELRRRRRVGGLLVDTPDDRIAAPEDAADAALRRTAVRAAVATLSPRERELVALKFHGGLTNGEIARVLGISETAAGSLLYRTIEKLRRECDATG
jgi:RNA polymerase sigma factor (sigma-70 family)